MIYNIILGVTSLVPLVLAIIYWDRLLELVKKKQVLMGVIIGAYISILGGQIYGFGEIGTLQKLDKGLTDSIITTFTNRNANSKKETSIAKHRRPKNNSLIVYGLITGKSLTMAQKTYKMGWPWRRKTYAKVSEFLHRVGAKLAIYDIVYSEVSPYYVSEEPDSFGRYLKEQDDKQFADVAEKTKESIVGFMFDKREKKPDDDYRIKYGQKSDDDLKKIGKQLKVPMPNGFDKNAVLEAIAKLKYSSKIEQYALNVDDSKSGMSILRYHAVTLPYKEYMGKMIMIASVNAFVDSDGLIRRTPLIYWYNKKYYPSLSFASYLHYIGFDYKNETIQLDGRELIVRGKRVPLDDNGNIRIKYYGWANKKGSKYDDIYSLFSIVTFYEKAEALYNRYQLQINGEEKLGIKKPEDLFQNIDKYNAAMKEIAKTLKGKQLKFFTTYHQLNKYEKTVINSDLKGKLVMIGSVAPALLDIRKTPFLEKEAGAHIHVSALDNLIQGDFLKEWETWKVLLIIIIVSLITGVATSGSSMLRAVLSWLGMWIFLGIFGVVLFMYFNIVMDIFVPLLSVFMVFLLDTIIHYFAEQKEKGYIKGAFGQYLSPKVIDILINDPSKLALGGQRKIITAFFSDVAGFSTISEKLTPDELVSLLNIYLTEMCDIVAKYDGTVDKFEGDAIIAFWGAPLDEPEHARLACFTTIEMQQHMDVMRAQFASEGRDPLISGMTMRVGLNSGPAVIGNMGSKTRMDYTMMGDTVNLAARLEGANKFYGTYSMISGATYDMAKDHIDVRELDKIQVVGKKEAVMVYELLNKKNQVSGAMADGIAQYMKAMDLYKQQKFVEAIQEFEKVLPLIPGDMPSKTYIDRCHELKVNPPGPDWDGRYVLTGKG